MKIEDIQRRMVEAAEKHDRELKALQLREQQAKTEQAESALRVALILEKHVSANADRLELPKISGKN
jgi:hypothetical protein